jgi:pyrroline-5-carboxylate reductase
MLQPIMSIDKTIGFIGAGNMAEAMIRGLLRGGDFAIAQIAASGPREERMRELRDAFGIYATVDNRVPAASEIVVLCVKPQILSRVLDEVGSTISPDALVISIAAGVPVAAISPKLAAGTRVVRAMPNTPALVDAAATAIARGEYARESDIEDAKRIFDAIGTTVVLDESLMDAVTGLSGSGPAYVFRILEALSDAGVKVGSLEAFRDVPGERPRGRARAVPLRGTARDRRKRHPRLPPASRILREDLSPGRQAGSRRLGPSRWRGLLRVPDRRRNHNQQDGQGDPQDRSLGGRAHPETDGRDHPDGRLQRRSRTLPGAR